jgi:hypothetical protein
LSKFPPFEVSVLDVGVSLFNPFISPTNFVSNEK